MKTQEEIESLKESWKYDPIWDIEETEGFEDHKEELSSFRKECQEIWNERFEADLKKYCEIKGFDYPHQSKLAINFRRMEESIDKLNEELYKIKNR